jgi:hypothetical protein
MENIHVVAPQDAAFASDDLEAVRAELLPDLALWANPID